MSTSSSSSIMLDAYITLVEAEDYFETYRLETLVWDSATEDNKVKALNMSTCLIDTLNFLGTKTDSTQAHQFPRNQDTEVPTDIKRACAELAYELLDDVNPNYEMENLIVTQQTYANVRITRDTGSAPIHLIHGIPSATAWKLLSPYLYDPNTISVVRVS